MRPIDANVAGNFVNFVLDPIEWGYLDVSVYNSRRFRADFETVPGMRAPTIIRRRKNSHMPPLKKEFLGCPSLSAITLHACILAILIISRSKLLSRKNLKFTRLG